MQMGKTCGRLYILVALSTRDSRVSWTFYWKEIYSAWGESCSESCSPDNTQGRWLSSHPSPILLTNRPIPGKRPERCAYDRESRVTYAHLSCD